MKNILLIAVLFIISSCRPTKVVYVVPVGYKLVKIDTVCVYTYPFNSRLMFEWDAPYFIDYKGDTMFNVGKIIKQ